MRNLLALAAIALITFAALGWYLDWYHISSTPASEGHRRVNIDVNTTKIGHDVEKGGEKVRKILETHNKKDAEPKADSKDPPKSEPPANEPPPLNLKIEQ
jgi:hypothetical protein